MKKLILLISILFLFLCNNAFASRLYGCTSLTGGGTGALDALDITAVSSPNTNNLANGDGAIVVTATNAYLYYFNSTATEAESSPTYVRPDDYTSAGVWVKVISVVSSEIQTLVEGFLSVGGCSGSVSCTAEQIVQNQNMDMGTGTLDIDSKTITFPAGGWYFADENTSPSVVGQFKYNNTVTGLDDGALLWYDDDEVKYLIDTPTLPTVGGQVPVYSTSNSKWSPGQRNAVQHTTKSGAYTVGTDSPEECYGGVIYVTSAATITACDNLTSEMSFTVVTIGNIAVSVDTQADDLMLLDGNALNDGDKATNTSTNGDTIHFSYYSVNGWYVWSGSPDGDHWTDGGP